MTGRDMREHDEATHDTTRNEPTTSLCPTLGSFITALELLFVMIEVGPVEQAMWLAPEARKVTLSEIIGVTVGSFKWLNKRASPPRSSGTFLSSRKNEKRSKRLEVKMLLLFNL